MIVAASGGNQVQVRGQGTKARSFSLIMIGMLDLQAGQPGGGQCGDRLAWDLPAAGDSTGMREHRGPACVGAGIVALLALLG